jgi:hypothetical protein
MKMELFNELDLFLLNINNNKYHNNKIGKIFNELFHCKDKELFQEYYSKIKFYINQFKINGIENFLNDIHTKKMLEICKTCGFSCKMYCYTCRKSISKRDIIFKYNLDYIESIKVYENLLNLEKHIYRIINDIPYQKYRHSKRQKNSWKTNSEKDKRRSSSYTI